MKFFFRVKPDEPSLMEDSRIKKLAEKYNKSPAQVMHMYNSVNCFNDFFFLE